MVIVGHLKKVSLKLEQSIVQPFARPSGASYSYSSSSSRLRSVVQTPNGCQLQRLAKSVGVPGDDGVSFKDSLELIPARSDR